MDGPDLKGDGGITSPATALDINGAITFTELSANPAEGKTVMWTSDGTGTGDDGDVLMKITAGGTTNYSKEIQW